jgi:hypothetical protein
MQLLRPAPAAASGRADGGDAIEQQIEGLGVVDVGGRYERDKRDALPVDNDVVLRAELPAIGGVRPRLFAPLFAGTLEASSAARSQSMRSASPNSSSMNLCSFCQTPAVCQSRSRRQQVMPQPAPIS